MNICVKDGFDEIQSGKSRISLCRKNNGKKKFKKMHKPYPDLVQFDKEDDV